MRLSDERLKEIMNECDKYEITLAHDPTVLGPAYLQDLIARCRNFTNHVVTLLNEVKRSKMALDMDVRRKKAAFKISSDEYLAKNAVVRNLPNIKDREAQINLMLRSEHQEIVDLENDILDLDHVLEVVKIRHRELKDTMREIQTQRALIRDDRDTGAVYGDERPGMNAEDADVDSAYEPGARTQSEKKDDAEIERMLRESLGDSEVTSAEPEPVSATAPVQAAEERQLSPVEQMEAVASKEIQAIEDARLFSPEPAVEKPLDTAPETPKSDEDLIQDFLAQDDAPAMVATPKDEDSSPSIPAAAAMPADDDMADLIANL